MPLKQEKEFSARILELETEIKKIKSRKKYGLIWEHKTEEVIESCKEKLPVLTEDDSKENFNYWNGWFEERNAAFEQLLFLQFLLRIRNND